MLPEDVLAPDGSRLSAISMMITRLQIDAIIYNFLFFFDQPI